MTDVNIAGMTMWVDIHGRHALTAHKRFDPVFMHTQVANMAVS